MLNRAKLAELTGPELHAVTAAFMGFTGALGVLQDRGVLGESLDVDMDELETALYLTAMERNVDDAGFSVLSSPELFKPVDRPDGLTGWAPNVDGL